MTTYFFISLWLSIGAISYILSDNEPSTRGEFISSLFYSSIFMPLSVVSTIIDSKWWNEKL